MIVLGIESSCDETACSIVRDGRDILSNVISSQIDLHKEYGGVVPELACRRHIDVIIPVIDEALKDAGLTLDQIDLIAVAHGPGLIGALFIGLNTAKGLSLALQKPLIGVNHLEAHLYAALMSHSSEVIFPCLGVILSGGHTALVLMKSISSFELIGETADDAIGEAFDKVAKLLELPYPGGPQIESLALQGNPMRFGFRPGRIKGRPLDFSFSGLKTAVLYTLKDQPHPLTDIDKADLAASFQRAALQDVVSKTLLAAKEHPVSTILFGGGVTNNQRLRELFKASNSGLQCLWPLTGLSLDNAAMVAGLGYHLYLEKGYGEGLDLQCLTRIPFAAPPTT